MRKAAIGGPEVVQLKSVSRAQKSLGGDAPLERRFRCVETTGIGCDEDRLGMGEW
jgi:hypothetical protein